MFWITVALGAVLALVFLWLRRGRGALKKRVKKESPLPPGPSKEKSIKLIRLAGGLFPFLEKAHHLYGATVHFYSHDEPTVSTMDRALLKALLREGERPRDIFRFLEPVLGHDNFQVYSAARAKPIRRLMLRFGTRVAQRDFAVLKQMMLDVVRSWQRGQVIDVQREMLSLGLRVAVRTVTGAEPPSAEDAEKFQQQYDDSLSLSFQSQFRELTQVEQDRRKDAVAKTKSILRELREKGGGDFEEMLIEADIDRDERDGLVSALILASYHTSSVGTSWVLHYLSQHPDVQTRVREEVFALGSEFTLDRLEALRYLNAVVSEALRCKTPGPFLARKLSKEVAGIPAGYTVMVPLQLLHNDPSVFPDPHRFDPERFLGPAFPQRSYLPFGLGNRSCSGERLAWAEIKTFVAVALMHASYEPQSYEQPVVEQGFVQLAKDGIMLKVV